MENNLSSSKKASLKHEISHIWDHSASTYDSQYAHGLHNAAEKQAWLNALQNLLGSTSAGRGPGLKIADVGTGTGFLALLLAELGHEVTGFDLSEGMLEQARQKASKQGMRVNFETGDAESLPLDNEAVDLVISRHVLWTLPDPEAALADWKRVVRPGGQVIVIDGLWDAPGSFFQRVGISTGRVLLQIQQERARIKELQNQKLTSAHTHAHSHDHSHSHTHDPANDHDHTHDHSELATSDQPHTHPHNHDHAHDQEHLTGHSHAHAYVEDHSHDHLHSKEDHAHEHSHDHDPGHEHSHQHPAGAGHDHTHGEGSGHHYSPDLKAQLPATRFRTYQEIESLFSKAGLNGVSLTYLDAVDKAERAAMPFLHRLANSPNRHYVLSGKK